jgi:hypothetical protein
VPDFNTRAELQRVRRFFVAQTIPSIASIAAKKQDYSDHYRVDNSYPGGPFNGIEIVRVRKPSA